MRVFISWSGERSTPYRACAGRPGGQEMQDDDLQGDTG
jgi:hypothetical protein